MGEQERPRDFIAVHGMLREPRPHPEAPRREEPGTPPLERTGAESRLNLRTDDDRSGGRLESLTDEQLVAQINAGNSSAFNSLTERWESSLYRFIRRMVGNPEDARDVCQEALAKAYLNIGRLRDGAKFRSWLHYIALNLVRDRTRTKKSKTVLKSYEEGGLEVFPDGATRSRQTATERQVDRTSLRDLMDEVLAGLPVEQRTAIVLREYQGFTSDEIAEMTGVPSATVRSRIFYGFRALRTTLRERGVTEEDMAL